jgi:hypothetical protein
MPIGRDRSVETGPGSATPARDVTGGREWATTPTNEIGHGGSGASIAPGTRRLAVPSVKIIKQRMRARRALREGRCSRA